MKVKICGLARRQDVELAMELGADALGFIFEPSSPRYIKDPHERAQLVKAVHPFLPTVGVYGQCSRREDTCLLVQAVEFQTDESFPRLHVLRFESGTGTDEAITAINQTVIGSNVVARGIVLDGFSRQGYGGMGVKVDWHLAAEIVRRYSGPVVLAGGLTPENVASAIEIVRPYAVDVSSGIEATHGVKDPVMMRDFIQAAKSA